MNSLSASYRALQVRDLVDVFYDCYAIAYRQYLIEIGDPIIWQTQLFDFEDAYVDRQEWRKVMQSLVARNYNPLQVIRHEMRRYKSANEPAPPRMSALMRCYKSAEELEIETKTMMASVLASDLSVVKRIETTTKSIFNGKASNAQLVLLACEQINSCVLITALLDYVNQLNTVDQPLLRAAVLEYLECPQVYHTLELPLVANHLLSLNTFLPPNKEQ